MEITMQNSEKSVQYTQDIKNDLKADIRRLEGVVETVERTTKQSMRETESDIKILRKETEVAIKDTNSNLDKKIQRALDNPLSNGK
jgi:predicted  nucleic acid-binding Zn-ribbon protein